MNVGYARVSTLEQSLNLQRDALTQAGCEQIVVDEVSGSVADRPGLNQLNTLLRKGDVLVVWRLDRLGRTLRHLINWINELDKAGVAFKSLTESIDTTTPSGRFFFHVFGALAEFEHQLIKERTRSGLAAARARGRMGGRPFRLDAKKRALAVGLYRSKQHSIKEICQMMGISKPTLYKYVRAQQGELQPNR